MIKKLILCVGCIGLSACAGNVTHTAEIHKGHDHIHGKDCGHIAVVHNDHVDYLHDGHLHNMHDGHIDDHVLEVSDTHPVQEVLAEEHGDHMHAEADATHIMVPHGDHMDFYHDGHLHHVHGDHIDEHGILEKAG